MQVLSVSPHANPFRQDGEQAGFGARQIVQVGIEPLQQLAIMRHDMGEFLGTVGRQFSGFQNCAKCR